MAREFDISNPVDYAAALINPETGTMDGKILAYYTKSGTCYVALHLYAGNILGIGYRSGKGKAGGYGYDKLSSAIADAVKDAGISLGDSILRGSAARFTGCTFTLEQVREICKRDTIIPVYAGSGNQRTAFEIFWKFEEVKG